VSIDLSLLPAPAVIEPLDYETILATIKADVLALAPELADVLALESEPITKLCQVVSYRELLLRARINGAARATMLAYAEGTDLDHRVALIGVERLPGESDTRLRARAQISPEGYSTAGPTLSYVFHALSASTQVADVYVDSPAPGDVRVTVLALPSANNPGGAPGAALLDQVRAALNADDVRPLNDNVVVEAASIITYAVSATLVFLPGPDIATAMQAAATVCQEYVDGQFKLGYDVTVSGLHAALHQPGVMRVDLVSPTGNIIVANNRAARCTGVTVNFGGVAS